MFNLDIFAHDKLNAISLFLDRYSLQPGDDCNVYLSSWESSGHRRYTVEIVIHDLKTMKPSARHQLKRDYKLEVPTWAIGTESPSLEYLGQIGTDDLPVFLNISVRGAYVCIAKGEEEISPSTSALKEAQDLESMTPEQALTYVQDKAKKMREPIIRPTFDCRPI